MNCEEFLRRSEEWMEGQRSEDARLHAMSCERCAALVEDLDAIRLTAPQIAETVAPPERLWNAIHARLEEEGLIRRIGWRERLAGRVHISMRPVAAAVAALALALLTVTINFRVHRAPVAPSGPDWLSTDQPELASVDTQLNHVEVGTIRSLHTADPAIQDTLQQNLMIINRQIALCEKTLEQAPSDQNTQEYLYDAYQQKADLLNMIAERNIGTAE